jgi:phosphate transport system ATP-binding protein
MLAIGSTSLVQIHVNTDDIRGPAAPEVVVRDLSIYYGDFKALDRIALSAPHRRITAIIGTSGSGKSTLLRAMNRMHEQTPGVRTEGQVLIGGQDINQATDLVALRTQVGMIFQRPNPLPISIFDNVAYGLRLQSQKIAQHELPDRVEQALRAAALWDEVKDKLKQSGLALSGGQQQRLCIARAIALQPQVLLMDEPCSALDPIATHNIEDLMHELEQHYTIVIVTHNLQQAGRVADQTVFMSVDPQTRAGIVIEAGPTRTIFHTPHDPRTQAYVSGRFG